jgi:hypothetical protein
MSRKYSSRRHSRRSHRGGTNAPSPSSYSSAATYGLAINGSGNSQFNRVFDQNGPDGSSQSNTIIGLQGQRAGKRRGKRGGVWGEVINQAIVPFSLFAAQNTYRPKSRQGGRRTRRKSSSKRSRRHH